MWVLYMMILGYDLSTSVHVEKINVFRSRDTCIIASKEYATMVTPDPRLKLKELPVWTEALGIDDKGNTIFEENRMRLRYGCVYIHDHRKTLRDVSTFHEKFNMR